MIRTRFAPSPTGFLHVGGLRTALYNYLFARKHQGQFILRIEDTDQSRQVPGAVENLLDALHWAGVHPDEGPVLGGDYGPYIQSQRLSIYREQLNVLIQKGYAYPCFCSSARLEELKRWQAAHHQQPRYDNRCRSLSPVEAQARCADGEAHVIRLKVPTEGEVIVNDLIRGTVPFPCSQLDDQVLLKSDGYPTYHLANVVDDHLMQISHVIRGEEWLPSTPKHVLLYQFFGWEPPQFAHLSLLLNPDKSKLSKRQGDVAVEDYRRAGYLPTAVINFLALLGWNPGDDREIFSMTDLINEFSLERVGKSGAIFNIDKLRWMNGYYIRKLDDEQLYQLCRDQLPAVSTWPAEKIKKALKVVQDSLITLNDVTAKTSYFFVDKLDYTQSKTNEWLKTPEAKVIFPALLARLETVTTIDGHSFVEMIRTLIHAAGFKGKAPWMAVRCALTGEAHGPELHLLVDALGQTMVRQRIENALHYVNEHTATGQS